ncbi:MAG: type II secretion system protein [Patescibacteria group bacterium]
MFIFNLLKRKQRKGFTLVELLVVTAIIAMLALIVVINVSQSQKRSRDSRRKADLNSILTAMLFYYDDHNTLSLAGCNCGYNNEGRGWFNYVGGGSYATSIAEYLKSSNYLSSTVIDPSGKTSCMPGAGGSCDTEDGGPYMLHYDLGTGKKITVYAKMESTKSVVDVNNSCNSSPAIPPAGTLYCTDYYRNYSLTATK